MGLRLNGQHRQIYVTMGDGELDEGNVWEAAMLAPKYNLDTITVIVGPQQHPNRWPHRICFAPRKPKRCGKLLAGTS